jgi:K+-transporting ATPase KdpF subunit
MGNNLSLITSMAFCHIFTSEGARQNGPDNLASGNAYPGAAYVRSDVRLHTRMRQYLKGSVMDILTGLTAIVTVLLLIYLFVALVRPEWF